MFLVVPGLILSDCPDRTCIMSKSQCKNVLLICEYMLRLFRKIRGENLTRELEDVSY